MTFKTEGVILKRRSLTEADSLFSIYTKDFGKIFARARSVRKSQAKLKGHLEPFVYSRLMIAEGRGYDILINAEEIENFPNIHCDLQLLAGAYCLSELTDKIIAGSEADSDIWDLILASFRSLDSKSNTTEALVNGFGLQLLNYLGYGDCRGSDFYDFLINHLGVEINSKDFLQTLVCVSE